MLFTVSLITTSFRYSVDMKSPLPFISRPESNYITILCIAQYYSLPCHSLWGFFLLLIFSEYLSYKIHYRCHFNTSMEKGLLNMEMISSERMKLRELLLNEIMPDDLFLIVQDVRENTSFILIAGEPISCMCMFYIFAHYISTRLCTLNEINLICI